MFSKFKHTHWLIVFFVSYFSIWFVVSLFNNIHPDSLDHWGWSQHLALGYISNPPMIVYWMKVMSFFVSNEILAIKLGGVFEFRKHKNLCLVVLIKIIVLARRNLWFFEELIVFFNGVFQKRHKT